MQLDDAPLEALVRERIAAKLAAAADDIEAYAAAKLMATTTTTALDVRADFPILGRESTAARWSTSTRPPPRRSRRR